MQFGQALRISPAVDEGRVLFGVYDARPGTALAVLTSVRAGPLGNEWLAPGRGDARGFDEGRLEGLREEAVTARALSPRWIEVAPDGGVTVAESQGVLGRSLAGFYALRLVPMAEFSGSGASVLGEPARAERARAGLLEAVRGLDAAGLNLRLRGDDARQPAAIAFLTKLRAALRASGRSLWVTVDGAGTLAPALSGAVDGLLRPSVRRRADLEVLEGVPPPAAGAPRPEPAVSAQTQPRTTRQTVSRAQWEPASIQ
jgi:hypothetical protein